MDRFPNFLNLNLDLHIVIFQGQHIEFEVLKVTCIK